ncbi:MAG: hypothetical protein KZQ81_08015, partial [Candidatus Thiodiazotropha sp. (ex Rostrolucina anterorostrata)]|nr:hypothetical protein [Candidatus Thiodiazotropha sp. (ex Rostrolucina anterorostrata)]
FGCFDVSQQQINQIRRFYSISQTPDSVITRVVVRRAGMHKCRGHKDVRERPLPCTTTNTHFTLSNCSF